MARDGGIGKLKKELKQDFVVIREKYKKLLDDKDEGIFAQWLSDNYYILEREYKVCVKLLKAIKRIPEDTDGFPCVFNVSKSFCAEYTVNSAENIEVFFKSKRLSGRETDVLPLMLRCALLERACEACLETGEKAVKLMENTVKAFVGLPDIDFEEITEKISPLEQILLQDPSGVYPHMDESGKSLYRKYVYEAAERQNVSDISIAEKCLYEARKGDTPRQSHIGRYLVPERHKGRGIALITAEVTAPLVLAVALSILTEMWYVGVIAYLPLWEICKPLIETLTMKRVTPTPFLRMKYKNGVPDDALTLITVSTLLPSADKAESIKKRMTELWRSNGQNNVKICMLADLKGAATPEKPEDKSAISAASAVFDELNSRYGGGFVLAVRPRIYSETQNSFTGKERKRGAVTELIRAIKGNTEGFSVLLGDIGRLSEVKYLLALDSDTVLPLKTAEELISVAEHPLNRAVIDTEKGRVTAGYGVFTPRVGVENDSAMKSAFAKLMAGEGGITLYNSLAAERYQDLFSDGIFAGKGLINVDSFYKLLDTALPEERILSHDILEGGFLRVGYVSDLQITDGFPLSANVYYDRLERWIRGDWQNAGFIFTKNPLNALSRYKLLDNLRRSLTPIIAMVGIYLSLLLPNPTAWIVLLISALSAAAGNIFAAFRTVASGGTAMFSRLYYSGTMPAALGDFLRGIINIILLPETAFISFAAIVRALWRQLISKKNLLQWTTFAQSGGEQNFWKTVRKLLPSAVSAVLLLIFGAPVQRLCGVLFLMNLFFTPVSAIEKKSQKESGRIDFFEREKLYSWAAAMWRYFDELCTPENNMLPPDNMQETPVLRTAQRTSPTNIGLMLLCVLAARDFGFISSRELCDRLCGSLDSIEKLEKWNGNLLNWYNTKNLRPLFPRYVSTVDSGNLLCCLVALVQGLKTYWNEDSRIYEICERAEKLISECELAPLYNKNRNLFHIGFDLETGEKSKSYYDLLMSEARMTGYYAVASSQVPKKHWGTLGRLLLRSGRYTGLASWTGTMFEFFMPYIFLPAQKGTLGYESLKFCLWCQRKRTEKIKINGGVPPWGISESGFYAFDRSFNYQYKANGVQKLGLKRGLDSDLVISPYSVFLALPLSPAAALKNLEHLESMEMTGRYGFYEAVDFTQSRTMGQDYAVVRSYMAHHVGMSMLCVLNLVKGNIVQKRFMSDERMSGAKSLLQEKIPSDAPVFKDIEVRQEQRVSGRSEPQSRQFEINTPLAPQVSVLTNGEWSTVITDVGASLSIYRNICITRHSQDIIRNPQGVFAWLDTDWGILPAVKSADYSVVADYDVEFTKNGAIHTSRRNGLVLTMETAVHPRLPCEQRRFTVRNLSTKRKKKADLIICFEPSLDMHRQSSEHYAFSKLFLEDSFDKNNRCLVFSRVSRTNEEALYLVVGFTDKEIGFSVERSREKMLRCAYESQAFTRGKADFDNIRGNPDAYAAFRITLLLKEKEEKSYSLVMCAAATREEAINTLIKVREGGAVSHLSGAPELFAERGLEAIISDTILPQIFYMQKDTKESLEALKNNRLGINALWELGISGDNPIIFIEVHNAVDVARAAPYIRINKRLRAAGILTDLVIGYREGGEYTNTILEEIREELKKEGCESAMDTAGGVHAVNFAFHSDSRITTVKAAAVFVAPRTAERFELPHKPYVPLLSERVKELDIVTQNRVKQYNFTGDKITIGADGKKPVIPWSFINSNRSFGTMISDKSLGFTWAINANENKLTPWTSDTKSDNRGELMLIRIDGKIYDLTRDFTAMFSSGLSGWSGKTELFDFTLDVSVPQKGNVKYCDLKIIPKDRFAGLAQVVYYIEPVLGKDRSTSKFIHSKQFKNGVIIASPWSEIRGVAALMCESGIDFCCCSKSDFWEGRWQSEKQLPLTENCVSIGKNLDFNTEKEINLRFSLSWAHTEYSSVIMPSVCRFVEKENSFTDIFPNRFSVETPDENLNKMVNFWLPKQIVSSRLFGRTGFYQCGGAWGFRDQLQDVAALVMLDSKLVKQHILRSAAVQFEEGDVLHWWHNTPGRNNRIKGVRTRYSDDLLWLPLVVSEYVISCGDEAILDIRVPYLSGAVLSDDEIERYFEPSRSGAKGSLYEHCCRAVDRSMKFGEHGLPLIGGGDWNDGYNRIGIKGKGESVWLAQFMIVVLKKLTAMAKIKKDIDRIAKYEAVCVSLMSAIEAYAWRDDHYLRAFYDNGKPLDTGFKVRVIESRGGETVYNNNVFIDSVSQSFAVFAELPNEMRRNLALTAALNKLVDEKNGIIKLLSPPFRHTEIKSTGYIAAYPQGVRENGGQYTHAAVWLAMALLRENRINEAWKLLKLLNPANLCEDNDKCTTYGAEPYALAGDICAGRGKEGHAGWSLYTGAAAWYYRTVCNELLGIRIQGDKIFINPKIPGEWNGYKANLEIRGTKIEILVIAEHNRNFEMTVDDMPSNYVPIDCKAHSVTLIC